MSYKIEYARASSNGYHTPAAAKKYYGKYSRSGITVHWWGDPKLNPDSAHSKIVSYILTKARKGTGSVNYVLSNTKITELVHPDNVAWASQAGNPTTISVEFSPNLNAEGYKKAGWLIYTLEKKYGKTLKLYPHKHWYATACPGKLSLDKMRQEANKWKPGGAYNNPKPKKPTWVKVDNPGDWITTQSCKVYDLPTGKVVDTLKKGTIRNVETKTTYNGRTYLRNKTDAAKKRDWGVDRNAMEIYKKPTPKPEPKPQPVLKWSKLNKPQIMVAKLNPTKLWDFNQSKWSDFSEPITEVAKGTEFEAYGKCENRTLGSTFLVNRVNYSEQLSHGFNEADLELKANTQPVDPEPTPNPTPEPTPTDPEWVTNLRDIDATQYWLANTTPLVDITTGKPLANVLEKDQEFIASAITIANGVEYRITDYSYQKKIFNGVPIQHLTLTPPGEDDIPPEQDDPDLEQRVSILEKLVQAIVNALAQIGIKLKG